MTDQISQEELQSQIRYVSHEIRNHLSICDMYTQIIRKNLEKEGIKNASTENAIDCIQKSVQIIGANLLELKSLNSANLRIMDFEEVIKTSVKLAQAYVVDKNIEFETFIKNTGLIEADENKFPACLVNVLKNAIEAIDAKGKIEILAEIKNDLGVIKIINNGKPIPKEKQEQIFTQGYTTKKTGCGLGLAICKKHLNSQGADIKLTKSSKTQTVFEITIPVCK